MGDMRDAGGVSMWEDPEESPAVRQLLRAGRAAQYGRHAQDYDVERGLARHLANLSAGAPLPSWYTGVAGITAAAVTSATVQKSATTSFLAWLVPPIVGAGLLSAWLWVHSSEAPKPTLAAAPVGTLSTVARTTTASPSRHEEPTTPAAIVAPARRDAARVAVDDSVDEVVREHVNARVSKSNHHVATSSHSPARARRLAASASESGEGAPARGAVSGGGGVATSNAPVEFGADAIMAPAVSNHAVQSSAARVASTPQPMAAAVSEPEQEPRAQAKDKEAALLPAPRVESESKLEREMQMLAVAQRVLVDDPSRALRLTRQGEQEFGKSMFSAERKQVSLLALVQLGRLDEARRLGVPFLRAYPKAPWSARLREALSTGQLPTR
jgi:hypothetical protein